MNKDLDSIRLEILIGMFVNYKWGDIEPFMIDGFRPNDEKYITKESLLKLLDAKIEFGKNRSVNSMDVEKKTEDEIVFGKDQWIYCSPHLRPHNTGWCTVSVSNKLGLGIFGFGEENLKKAYQKCRDLGLEIYRE